MIELEVDEQSASENLLYGRLAEENSRAAFRRVDKKKVILISVSWLKLYR